MAEGDDLPSWVAPIVGFSTRFVSRSKEKGKKEDRKGGRAVSVVRVDRGKSGEI